MERKGKSCTSLKKTREQSVPEPPECRAATPGSLQRPLGLRSDGQGNATGNRLVLCPGYLCQREMLPCFLAEKKGLAPAVSSQGKRRESLEAMCRAGGSQNTSPGLCCGTQCGATGPKGQVGPCSCQGQRREHRSQQVLRFSHWSSQQGWRAEKSRG